MNIFEFAVESYFLNQVNRPKIELNAPFFVPVLLLNDVGGPGGVQLAPHEARPLPLVGGIVAATGVLARGWRRRRTHDSGKLGRNRRNRQSKTFLCSLAFRCPRLSLADTLAHFATQSNGP